MLSVPLTWYSVLEAELRCDDYLGANRSERLAKEFFVCKRTVCFGRVKERNTTVMRGADQIDGFVLLSRRTEAEAKPILTCSTAVLQQASLQHASLAKN